MTSIPWYQSDELYSDYVKLIDSIKVDKITVETLSKVDQIHAGGLVATKKIIEKSVLSSFLNVKSTVLELGGGIGGVARILATNFGSKVINLDLSICYSITGKKLTDLCEDCKETVFIAGDAILCPFKDCSFDLLWLQHVNMNIWEKKALANEISRILKKNGVLVFHEWFLKGSLDKVELPLPWAESEAYNHLCSLGDFLKHLEDSGLTTVYVEDESLLSIKFYKKLLENKSFNNPVFKQRKGAAIFTNAIKTLEEGVLSVYSGKMIKK